MRNFKAVELLKQRFGKPIVKSKSITYGQPELIYEVKIKNNKTNSLNDLCALEGVQKVILVSYNNTHAGDETTKIK